MAIPDLLPDWVFAHADRRPEAEALATPACRITYGALADRVRALAGQFAAAGLGPGDRLLVALPNSPATVVASLAVQALGGTAVEVNREWGPQVLSEVARQCSARQAVVSGRDARTWGKVCASSLLDRLWVVHGGELPPALLADLGPVSVARVLEDGRVDPGLPAASMPARPDTGLAAPALVLYTSGSTGRPRGVVQTFGNVLANTRSITEYLRLTAEDRALVVLPLYYCYGRSVLQTHLFAGGSVFLETRTAFPRVVLETLAAEGCTGFAGVPLTFEIFRRQIDFSSIQFPRLRYLTQAGGAMAPETVDWVRRTFRPAELVVMYGQTEATARLSYLPPARAVDKRGSMGVAIPGVQLAVVDDGGRELPPGETGHLVARGENITPGYLDEAEETSAILHDGWLWTGDLAYRDQDGFLFHRGRSKEMLKIGGHRVSPVEIEQVVAEHPAVLEAAVVGVPDDLFGEVPAAFVVPRSGTTVAEDELRRFCRERMPVFKVPVRIEMVAALPRNEAGKLLRAQLATKKG